jgi:ANTAR domain
MSVGASFEAEDDLCPNCLHLSRAVENRDLIGQAKGILMEREGCSPEAAFRMLVDASQRTNTKVVEVAAELARSVNSGPTVPAKHRTRPDRPPSAKATGTSSDKNREEHQRLHHRDRA